MARILRDVLNLRPVTVTTKRIGDADADDVEPSRQTHNRVDQRPPELPLIDGEDGDSVRLEAHDVARPVEREQNLCSKPETDGPPRKNARTRGFARRTPARTPTGGGG
jgi:hypothetical protein